jgi:hypothetical protein
LPALVQGHGQFQHLAALPQPLVAQQAMPRGAGGHEGAILDPDIDLQKALLLRHFQDRAIPVIDQRDDAVAEVVQGGAGRPQAEEQPADRQTIAHIGQPLAGGQTLLEILEEDEADQQDGRTGG